MCAFGCQAGNGLELMQVENFHVLAIGFQQALVLEMAEGAADGFDGEAQVVANILARQAEEKLDIGEVALF